MMRNSIKQSIFIFTIFLGLQSCSEDRESVKVESQDIVESVYSSVVVEPATVYKVNSTVSGYITAINFEIGDKVHTGDVIFKIRDIQGDNSTSNAELAYNLAKKNYLGDQSSLDDLKLEIENAKLKRKNDSINNERNRALFEKSIITKVEMEQSELLFTSSKNGHTSLVNKYKRLERDLKISLEQARNNYNTTLSRSNDALISSKIDGEIYDISKEPEELVMVQETVAIIGSDDDFVLKMLIDEVDITKVKIGQKIIVALEAYKDQVFEAEINRIAPKMDARTQTFEIEGIFTKPPKKLYMGLTGEGNIVIQERSKVLVIPLEYLSDENKVETDNGFVEVSIGARSLSHVEILSGLKEGDIIYKP
jgi:RND family efflux transporter MFP subunit